MYSFDSFIPQLRDEHYYDVLSRSNFSRHFLTGQDQLALRSIPVAGSV